MVKFLDLQAITMRHGDEIKAAIDRVVESGWFLQGNENKRFEMDYAKYIGTEFCVTVANGLDALKLILRGYKEMGLMQDGDEIIVPANTYIATILAITDNNLVPVLVEPTWDHLEINIDAIEEHITSKTKGVMIVHLYGRIAYNDKLRGICEKYNLKLMEGYDIPGGEDRGAHAHKECHQFIIAASGSFEVVLDDGVNKRTILLNRPFWGLHVPPGIWASEQGFSSGSICLVLASHGYSEEDYIRDYDEFLKYVEEQKNN